MCVTKHVTHPAWFNKTKMVAQNMTKVKNKLKRYARHENAACALCARREHAAATSCAP